MSITAELARVAAAAPDAPALLDRDRELTFRQLMAEVERVAAGLAAHGVPRGARVAVPAERHWTTIAGALGVLHAGAAYLPVSPGDPEDRLRSVLTAGGAVAVIGREPTLAALGPALRGLDAVPLPFERLAGGSAPAVSPDDLAYLMFTSGSTGVPKGVLVPHRAVLTAGTALRDRYGITHEDRVLNLTPLIWDTSGEEIYATLFGGAALVCDDRTADASIATLLDVVADRGVTVVNLATALWNELVDHLVTTGRPLPSSLRAVVMGGEEARARTVRLWSEHVPEHVRLINAYGQTETVMVTHAADIGGRSGRSLRDTDDVPIGHALPHIREILTDRGDGTAELAVGGPTVAWGYLHRPDLTGARFVPAHDGRAYLTGDVVRVRPDGGLTFLGRADRQLKIRGVRVEPAEVERAMTACPGVTTATVFAVDGEHSTLVGVYVPSATDPADPADVMRALEARLPRAMLPHHVHARPSLPLTATGKVDVNALRATFTTRVLAPGATDDAPDVLAQVAAAYREVLDAAADADSSYFDLGGDSLTAVRLLSRLNQRFDVRLGVRDVFDHPTPRLLAKVVEARTPS
ncbi:nonribosomal peptide synthetase protein VioO [Saccharothrix saharensis]|uniref:Nonribosomal peptide synthetase protein VioO n=1 Tax=Saccharothrix saharensis TaxID=571190 RepID=A0A543JRN5_9PSEU|nr:non-ribosomal peptide synthetase [Saccharothrix saharensis]TQM85414.1 nonribosomal peptide synthetase protein VioO [Saccharothrix saharensis]